MSQRQGRGRAKEQHQADPVLLGLQTKRCSKIPGTWHMEQKRTTAWVGGRFAYVE